jgi:hypothetical protein
MCLIRHFKTAVALRNTFYSLHCRNMGNSIATTTSETTTTTAETTTTATADDRNWICFFFQQVFRLFSFPCFALKMSS